MKLIRELNYLIFESNKQDEWTKFATDFLGMEVASTDGGDLRIRMDEQPYRFIIQPGDGECLKAAGFLVANSGDLAKLEAHLGVHGYTVTRGTAEEVKARGVEAMIWFTDPEGLRLEVVCNPTILSGIWNSPLIPGGFVTGEQGFGHIAICTADLPGSQKFYQEILGFKISDYIVQDIQGLPVKFTFFHVNARHHTLALAGLPMPDRMHHFMVQVKDIDVVGHALDRAREMELPLHMAIGRHPNDKMLSFYVATPSNFNVEFGVGGLEIDDAVWEVKTHNALSEWGHMY